VCAGQFCAPHGLAIDSHGDLYVAEVTQALPDAVGWSSGLPHVQKFRRR